MKFYSSAAALHWAALALVFTAFCAAQQRVSIAVIPKGLDRELWPSIHAGALKAKEEMVAEGFSVDILWKGSKAVSSREQQIQVVDTFTGQRLSGILVAAMDEEALGSLTEIDSATNVPLIYLDRSLDADKPISFVALDNYQGGALAADRLAQLIYGEGNVMMLRHAPGEISAEAREAGFVETLRKKYPSIRLVSAELDAGESYRAAYRACERLLSRHGRTVNGIFVSDGVGTLAMVDALRDFQLAGVVSLVGYEANETLLEAVRQSEVQGLVVSDPFRMGYLGVRTIMENLLGSNTPTIIDSGLTLVTEVNIDSEGIREIIHPPVGEYLELRAKAN